jgi:hypothetical protein
MDFGRNETTRLAMRFKRLKRRAFSPPSARKTTHPAFSLPQRA